MCTFLEIYSAIQTYYNKQKNVFINYQKYFNMTSNKLSIVTLEQ